MFAIQHEEEWEQWRPGVKTRSWTGAHVGAVQIRMGEQWFEPGTGVPRHWHYCEEHITLLTSKVEVWVDDEHAIYDTPVSLIFPSQARHKFMNVGDEPMHLIGAMSSPVHETFMVDDPPGVMWRAGDVFDPSRHQVAINVGAPTR